ncbi:teichoic acid glycerol-phosphate transferase [Paramixta manurensis]|uniref:Teichoic acid glycerol-phosphate transferase n=1 Tax=Paramixta manurensis TaxID=2740817 RepID=A0A6M8U4N0_9GAMM|nr:teichoic acid glycerol-phosphate transferase [Erwiniaceae bacterium PD-1]
MTDEATPDLLAIKTQYVSRLRAIAQRTVKKRLILFFGRESFSDNSKYLYLHMVENYPDAEVIWCSAESEVIEQLREHQLPHCDLSGDLQEVFTLLLHAAVAIFCVNPSQSLVANDLLFACLAGTTQIQLWHGVSVKKLLLQLTPYLSVLDEPFCRPLAWASRADYVLSPSANLDAYWHQVFGVKTLLRGGFPRNEVICRPATAQELIGAHLPPAAEAALNGKRRKLLLVPTWQRGKPTPLTEAGFLVRLVNCARKHNIDIFFKVHPLYIHQPALTNRQVDRLFILPAGVDLYPHLARFDLLMTDYSSIMFDFLLTGNPVMALDIQQGDHQRFEPDYSLLPPHDEFRHCFVPESVETVLLAALRQDDKQAARAALAYSLFGVAPGEYQPVNAALMAKVDRILQQKCAEDGRFEVM